MGKRKSARKPQGPKKVCCILSYHSHWTSAKADHGIRVLQKDPLPESFPCLFCNHEDAVKPKVDKKSGVGTLSCKVCGQSFQCSINYLSAPVDVYSEWVDAAGMSIKLWRSMAAGANVL
ncbi:hypothetical protein ACRALDRAFT_1062917 [Sodiomyces alcalophilus JCM 7366]|uniref:uncharacterized protein n=1 Tax=Sodiomyces alcalophilus JCM 7366 TaxID=591952 RepID=UPI0039B579C5